MVHGKWRGEAVFLTIATAVGGFLRFYRIGKECLWFDEIATAVRVHSSFLGLTDTLTKTILFPPLYYYMVKLWAFTAGTTPADLRSFSALWGTAAIPIIYLLAREMFGRKAAVVSTILLVFSAFNIYYSQEAKMYAMWWTLVLASNLFFVRAVKYGGRRSDLALYVAFTAAALWTHNFTVLVILSHVLYLAALLRPSGRWGRWLSVYLVIVFIYLPWPFVVVLNNFRNVPGGLPVSGAITKGAISWIPAPAFKEIFLIYVTWASGLKLTFYDIDTLKGTWYMPFPHVSGLCLLALALGLYPVLRAGADRRRFSGLVAITLLFPTLSVFVFSMVKFSLWHPRYLGFVAPFLFIALGYGYRLSDRKCITGAALAILLVLNLSVLDFYYSARVKKPWDELVTYLDCRVDVKSDVLFIHEAAMLSFDHHWNYDKLRRKRRPRLEYLFDYCGKMRVNVLNYNDVWFVASDAVPRGHMRRGYVREHAYWDNNYSLSERVLFSNGLKVLHYVRKRSAKDSAEER